MTGRQRPVRRSVVVAGAALVLFSGLVTAFPIAWLAMVVDPMMFWALGFVGAMWAAAAVWAWLDYRRTCAEAQDPAETDVPDVADHLPPPSPHRPAGKWLQACSRAARRIREGAR